MVKRILLDLDDTLNSWSMEVLRLYGLDCGPWDYHRYPIEERDIIRAIETSSGRRLEPSYFWSTLPLSIWSDAPKSLECDWLVEKCCELVGPENVLIATCPTLDSESLGAKVEWIESNLPRELWRQYAITPRKHWIEGVLVDDWEGQPGVGVVMPRPWNAGRGMSLEERKEFLLTSLAERLEFSVHTTERGTCGQRHNTDCTGNSAGFERGA